MTYQIEAIPGINPKDLSRLAEQGIQTTDQLLGQVHAPAQCADLAQLSGIPEARLTPWLHNADLLRINGIEPEIVVVLNKVGVTSLDDLSTRDTDTLAAALKEVDAPIEASRLGAGYVAGWIEEAKALPRDLFHPGQPPA